MGAEQTVKGGMVTDQHLPERNETGEMANPKRTQVSDVGETRREATSEGSQDADRHGDRHDQDWQAAAEEVREAADKAGKSAT